MRALTSFETSRVAGATSCQPAPTTCQPTKSLLSCLVDFTYFMGSLCKPRTSCKPAPTTCQPKPCQPKPSCGGGSTTPTNPPVDL